MSRVVLSDYSLYLEDVLSPSEEAKELTPDTPSTPDTEVKDFVEGKGDEAAEEEVKDSWDAEDDVKDAWDASDDEDERGEFLFTGMEGHDFKKFFLITYQILK